MANLTVWKFTDAGAAQRVEQKVLSLQQQELINVHDAAVVTWPEGKKKPKTKQLVSMVGAGAAGGSFWGLLFGIIFLVPFFGMVVGAATGALAGSLRDFGIDDDFIETVRAKVTPGTSALFLLTSGEVEGRVGQVFEGEDVELLSTNLSVEDEEQIRAMLADD
jgi:uncharacterized membrane protein